MTIKTARTTSVLHHLPMVFTMHEKRARAWDRLTTIIIVALLLLPFPFARFQIWPEGTIISEHLITPWSRFRICYISPRTGKAVEELYRFTWKGKILPGYIVSPHVFAIESIQPPLLKWQDNSERTLGSIFLRGDFLRLKTCWQPLLFWPLKMLWEAASNAE